MRRFSATLRASVATCLVFAGSASLATTPPSDIAMASLQAAYARAVTPGEQADQYQALFGTVLRRVQRSYATDVDVSALVAAAARVVEPLPPGAGDPSEVFRKAINTALRTLDPHSRYMDAQTHSNDRSDTTGSFVGLGIEIEPGEGFIRIVAPLPGSPAARAGLQRGDLIVRIDDRTLEGVPVSEAVTWLRGAPGTTVAIVVRRESGRELTVSVTRDTIRRQALLWSMEGDVLVLRLRSFTASVSSAVEKAVADASAVHPPRAIVLDMRGNPGGLLREAVLVADAFLSKGDIVSLRGRTSSGRTRQADPSELLADLGMVVLIDGRSASASELVAAALQDNGRAKVMGQRSFGKGSVQTTYPLGDMGALKLTTAFYHSPSGRAVHRTGVGPDIQLVNASQAERPRTDATGAQAPAEADRPQLPKARVEQARCPVLIKAADPALACAVAYLSAQNVDEFLGSVAEIPASD